jgi:hypothetical protein
VFCVQVIAQYSQIKPRIAEKSAPGKWGLGRRRLGTVFEISGEKSGGVVMAMRARFDRDIGPEIMAARRNHVPWKLLMRRYGLGRSQLNRYWKGAVKQFHKRSGSGD